MVSSSFDIEPICMALLKIEGDKLTVWLLNPNVWLCWKLKVTNLQCDFWTQMYGFVENWWWQTYSVTSALMCAEHWPAASDGNSQQQLRCSHTWQHNAVQFWVHCYTVSVYAVPVIGKYHPVCSNSGLHVANRPSTSANKCHS